MDSFSILWVVLAVTVIAQVYFWIMACSNTKDGPKYLVNPFHLFDKEIFTDAGNNYRLSALKALGVSLVILIVLYGVL